MNTHLPHKKKSEKGTTVSTYAGHYVQAEAAWEVIVRGCRWQASVALEHRRLMPAQSGGPSRK